MTVSLITKMFTLPLLAARATKSARFQGRGCLDQTTLDVAGIESLKFWDSSKAWVAKKCHSWLCTLCFWIQTFSVDQCKTP